MKRFRTDNEMHRLRQRMRESGRSRLDDEDMAIAEVIRAARVIQEFLWGGMNEGIGLEEFKRMFRKRVAKIEQIDMANPHWKVELKKRLLQTAAIAVNLIHKIDHDELQHDGIHPHLPSNLPQYDRPVGDEKKEMG